METNSFNFSQKLSKRRFVSVTLMIICLSGFIVQFYQLSDVFFKYQTSSRIIPDRSHVINYSTLVLCVRYVDVLDWTEATKFGLVKPDKKKYSKFEHEEEDLFDVLTKLNVSDLFDLTPRKEDVIGSCFFRNDNMRTKRNDKEECQSRFKTEKSITGESVCYSFIPSDSLNYTVPDVASSLTFSFEVYTLLMNETLERLVRFATLISHFVPDSDGARTPINSRRYGKKLVRSIGSDNELMVYFQKMTYKLLPPPMDTMCVEGFNQERCYNECISADHKKINRFPWSVFIDEDKQQDMRILTSRDITMNASLESFLQNSRKNCTDNCRKKNGCKTEFTLTIAYISTYENQTLRLAAMTPIDAPMTIEAVRILSLVEFLGQVGGSFGIWFGISLFSLDPSKWKIFNKGKKLCPRRRRPLLPGPLVRQGGAFFFKGSTLGTRMALPNANIGF